MKLRALCIQKIIIINLAPISISGVTLSSHICSSSSVQLRYKPAHNQPKQRSELVSMAKKRSKGKNPRRDIVSEFDRYFGNENELANWQRLCEDVGIMDELRSITQCRKVRLLALLRFRLKADLDFCSGASESLGQHLRLIGCAENRHAPSTIFKRTGTCQVYHRKSQNVPEARSEEARSSESFACAYL